MTWTLRARLPNLTLGEPVPYTKLELIERYNRASTLAVDGSLSDLAPILNPAGGIVVYDDEGTQRMSGLCTKISRFGADGGRASVIFTDDLVRLWWRYIYPVPGAAFTTAGQNVTYDISNDDAETRAIYYINRNIGPSAATARKVAAITVPTSLGRGPTAKTQARFNQLGPLVALMAENANLRLTITQSWPGGVPKLDVGFSPVLNAAAWARFGTPMESGPGLLGEDWSYELEFPAATFFLSAAGGEGTARVMNSLDKTATDEAVVWGSPRVEAFLDQRGTTEADEIAEGMDTAWLESMGTTSVTAPIVNTDLKIGSAELPLGSAVTCVLDGQVILERIREINTTIEVQDGTPTVKSDAVFGNPDGLKSPSQKQIRAMLRRVENLERI